MNDRKKERKVMKSKTNQRRWLNERKKVNEIQS